MRDISEHPITLPEIADILSELSAEMIEKDSEDGACGDLRAYALRKGSEIIAQLHHMVARAPDKLPVRPEEPTPYDIEDHGVALTDYTYREMVRLTLANPTPRNPVTREFGGQ